MTFICEHEYLNNIMKRSTKYMSHDLPALGMMRGDSEKMFRENVVPCDPRQIVHDYPVVIILSQKELHDCVHNVHKVKHHVENEPPHIHVHPVAPRYSHSVRHREAVIN